MAGYSKNPLEKKLGLKESYSVLFINAPENLQSLIPDMYNQVLFSDIKSTNLDYIHLFTKEKTELEARLPVLEKQIKTTGMIWVSWPKKASKVPSDLTEDLVRETALKLKLVDIKVCAVDEIWSGLKLVIRKELR